MRGIHLPCDICRSFQQKTTKCKLAKKERHKTGKFKDKNSRQKPLHKRCVISHAFGGGERLPRRIAATSFPRRRESIRKTVRTGAMSPGNQIALRE
jgi:hypothetical protein